MRIPRHIILRLLFAMLCLGCALASFDRALTDKFRNVLLPAGEATGSEVIRVSGLLMTGPGGPFSGKYTAIWNPVYHYGPTFVNAILAGLIALAAHALVSGPFGRTRLFGYRGPTRCGGCNYNLANLKSTRCPECGKVLARES